MNRQNLITIILASSITLSLSYYLIHTIVGDIDKKTEKVVHPVEISKDLAMPDPEVFNAAAVNPTIEVYIGSCVDSNQNGFLEPIEKLECAAPDSKKSNIIKNNDTNQSSDNKSGSSDNTSNRSSNPPAPVAPAAPAPQSQPEQPSNNQRSNNQSSSNNQSPADNQSLDDQNTTPAPSKDDRTVESE